MNILCRAWQCPRQGWCENLMNLVLLKFSFHFRLKIEYYDQDDIFDKHLEIVSETSNHATQECLLHWIDHINQILYRSGTTSLIPLADNYMTYHHGICFDSFDSLFEVYN